MNKFIGIKEVMAVPMTRGEYNEYRGWALPNDEDGSDEGFLVEYIDGGKSNDSRHQGYISWSPADVFHRAYFPFQFNFDGLSVVQLATMLKDIKNRLEYVTGIKTNLQNDHDALSINVLPELMDEDSIETLKIAGVGRLQCSSDIRCNVPSENKNAVQEWLKEHGHESMIKEEVNASTFKAFIKEMMKENKEWPKDLITVSPYSRATVVKA